MKRFRLTQTNTYNFMKFTKIVSAVKGQYIIVKAKYVSIQENAIVMKEMNKIKYHKCEGINILNDNNKN